MPRQSESTLAAIKQAIDIVTLIGEYLPLQRTGAKFKALCPFHDDHNPSLELNPERQSYKCWSCGAGGDIFDFIQGYERVDFPEAMRMLAERAGVVLQTERTAGPADGPSKSELLEVAAWAEDRFTDALRQSAEARDYALGRGLSDESLARFRLGFAPDQRDWLQRQAHAAGLRPAALEAVGLVARKADSSLRRDRFRGRLIFPIHDPRGRTIGFGGRILPETEKNWAERGLKVAKYLNSPETPLFQKRRTLYAADLARPAARQEGWVAVVEGYTDVIAAHQAGLANVVGTLGTALGDDHVTALRRLADRVVLVFDGDAAGQGAADRALEIFLGHQLDVRVLNLPPGVDPCDYLLSTGADAFRALVESAADPLDFAIDRAAERFDIDSPEGARQAAETVLAILARVPEGQRAGLDLKVAKGLDNLASRLRIPVANLNRELRRLRRPARRSAARGEPADGPAVSELRPIRRGELDRLDRELLELVFQEPRIVPHLAARVPADSLCDAPLRTILQTCYDLHIEGQSPSFDRVTLRLADPRLRALAAELVTPIDPAPLTAGTEPAPVELRLAGLLARLARREHETRFREVKAALAELDPKANPDDHQALVLEYHRLLMTLRPGSGKKSAS